MLQAHHEWKAPVAISTAYGHPVDGLLVATIPIGLGPFLTGCHVTTTWVWYLVITLHELNDHSGFHLPWLRSPQAHDYHHMTGRANFGNWCRLLDVVHGTDQTYRRAGAAWLRHTRLRGTTPAHVLYPGQ